MKDVISRTEIPLPNELPAPQFMKKDPATEEMLKQNQDLMARVAVSLRRVGELELQLMQYNEKIQHLKNQNQSISDSSLLNRELVIQKENELQALKMTLAQTEKDYAKLYSLHTGDLASFNSENEALKKSVASLSKFKQKVQEKIKPYFQDLAAKISYLQGQAEELERENHLLESRIAQLQQAAKATEKANSERIEAINNEWKIRMEHMEEILCIEREKSDQMQSKMHKMNQRMNLLENIDDEYTLAKNRAISAERARFELERKFEEQIRKMQQTVIELKNKTQQQDMEKRLLQQKLDGYANFQDLDDLTHVEQ
ncbi:MAG: hypothetical protein KDD37_04240 [Bdellovibrionales bacterium]|nr:hypothetical protein [Bdellovibrionales bacterium]